MTYAWSRAASLIYAGERDGLRIRAANNLSHHARNLVVPPELAQRAPAGDGFDATDAGGDAALGDELDETNFAGGVGVRAAA